MRKILFIYIFSVMLGSSFSQVSVYRGEKIYLAVEKEQIIPGDTLEMVGWLVEAHTFALAPYSSYVYVELTDPRDSMVVRQKLAVPSGVFHARLPIDRFQAPGRYYIRAYTQFMRNQPEWTFPLYTLQIGRGDDGQIPLRKGKTIDKVHFYPEGGHLVNDCLQQLVFEVIDPSGWPVEARAELIDSQGNLLQSNLSTDPAGRGSIRFIFREGEKYKLRVNRRADSSDLKDSRIYMLPVAEKHPSLQLTDNRGRVRYSITASPTHRGTYRFVLFFRGIYLLEDTLSAAHPVGITDLSGYPSGICAGLLLGEKNEVIAERLLFHLGNEYRTTGQTTSSLLPERDEILFKPGDNLPFSFARFDSLGSYRIRFQEIAPENDRQATHTAFPGHDIVSYLLLTSEFPADEFPFSGYTAPDLETHLQEIDRWLITRRWKRFSLPDVLQAKLTYRFPPEKSLLLQGRVETELGNPLKGGKLIAINAANGYTYEGGIDAKGRFQVAVDDFCEGQTFFLQAYDRKGKSYAYKVIPDPETYPGVDNRLKKWLAVPQSNAVVATSSTRIASGGITLSDDTKEEKIYRLPEIEVAARIRKEAPETQDFYVQCKITQELIQKRAYPDIISYLQDLSGIRVGKVSLNPTAREDDLSIFRYAIFTTRGVAVLKKSSDPYQRQPGELPVLLDGTLDDTHHVLTTLDPQTVASIERLTPGQALAYTSFGFEGAILIQTRDYRKEKPQSKGVQWQPPGLSSLSGDRPGGRDRLQLPAKPGRYRLILEGIDASGVPRYEAKQIVIQE